MLVGAIAGLGFGEILLIIVIAIVVLGPEKTPLYAKKLGEGLTMFKQYSGKLASEIKENVAEPLAEVVQPLQAAGIAVVMGDGHPDVKPLADFISIDAHLGGVGQALEELVLNG